MSKRSRSAVDIPDDDIIIVDEVAAPPVPEPDADPVAEPDTDPVAVLRRELDEHKAARAETERQLAAEKSERERVTVTHASDKLAQDKLVIEQAYTAAETRSTVAKRAFTDAMRAGDFNAAAEAQAAIARVENEMQRYADAYQVIEERAKAPAPAPRSADNDLEAQIAQIVDPATRQWATEHKDDLANPRRLNLAYAADSLAIARGLKPGSDAYLDFLDEQLGYMEQEEPAPAPKPAPAPQRRRALAVAAPVSRSTGGRVSITLTDTDKSFAQQLGMSHKDYARSLLAAKNDPRMNKYNNRYK